MYMTILEKVTKRLSSGKMASASAMANQFKTTKATIVARVADLRNNGMTIVTTSNRSGDLAYRLG